MQDRRIVVLDLGPCLKLRAAKRPETSSCLSATGFPSPIQPIETVARVPAMPTYESLEGAETAGGSPMFLECGDCGDSFREYLLRRARCGVEGQSRFSRVARLLARRRKCLQHSVVGPKSALCAGSIQARAFDSASAYAYSVILQLIQKSCRGVFRSDRTRFVP